ncbi:hypothetical protein Tco_0387323 [Tanacetum coccineum]
MMMVMCYDDGEDGGGGSGVVEVAREGDHDMENLADTYRPQCRNRGLLTKKFINLLKHVEDSVLDLNNATQALDVQKSLLPLFEEQILQDEAKSAKMVSRKL